MDPKGAQHLRRRLDSHAQWQRSAAVQNGEQPRADPDAADLIEFDEGCGATAMDSASGSSMDAGSPHSKATQPSDAARAASRVAR